MAGVMDPFQYNTIEIPTVVGLLKSILTQYPDNGQIIKELVQNAEDAEATRVEVIHDTRTFNFPNVHQDVRRFVKGPALCLYNDAVFSEEDWHGIRKLSDSIKKNDPLRVGQFGLGFKSIFHLTDYITIISGSSVLFMDPSEPEVRMCRSLSLISLKDVLPCPAVKQLWGTYINQGHLTSGNFPGTLFWFPLREQPSKISATIYTWDHVNLLFSSFSVEANVCLTFLKALEHVSLWRVTGETANRTAIHQVWLTGSTLTAAREQRTKLRRELRECGGQPKHTITSQYYITLRSVQGTQTTEKTVLVLHLLPGQHDAFGVKHGGKETTCLIPLVGVAAPFEPLSTERGHLFAFLPLPPDPANTTGLPVQINANFTLDQNRRHVKWRTHDTAKEPDVLWNEELVSRVVLEAYHKLLVQVHSLAVRDNAVEIWYSLLPDIRTVVGRWNDLARQLWMKLLKLPMICSQMQGFRQAHEVIRDDTLSSCSDTIRKCVREVLIHYKKPLATLPPHVSMSLQMLQSSPPAITPQLVRDTLKSVRGLKMEWNHIALLDYITSDSCYQDLQGIPLLPLNNGSWVTYDRSSQPVYICTANQATAFWGLQGSILLTDLPPALLTRLQKVAQNGTTQLVQLDIQRHAVDLLSRSVVQVQQHILPQLQFETWLRQVWELLQQVHLSYVSHLALLPSCHQPSSSSALLPLSSPIMVISPQTPLPEAAVEALTLLGVSVIPHPPQYVRHHQLYSYLHKSDSTGASQVLQKVLQHHDRQNLAFSFNAKISDALSYALVNTLDLFSLQPDVKNLLQKLNIFKAVDGKGFTTNACIESISIIAPNITGFPVRYPLSLLEPQSAKHKQLAEQLGARQLSKEALCLLAVSHNYSDRDIVNLTNYILSDRSLIANNKIFKELKLLKFIPDVNGILHLPMELYNPLDPDIDALIGEDLTPSNRYNEHLPVLLQLGLQQVMDMPQHVLVRAVSHVQASTLSQEEKTRKSTALLQVLERRADCREVCHAVRDVPFVFGKATRPDHYPSTLAWATQPGLLSPRALKDFNNYQDTLGSVVQLVDYSHFPNVTAGFGWNIDPDVSSFLTHFHNFLVASPLSTAGLNMSKKMYKHLSSFLGTAEACQLKTLSSLPCVFTQDGFKPPCQVYLRTTREDLQLLPYMHCLPFELQEYTDLFQFWGCFNKQTVELYLDLLRQIQNHHNTHVETDVDHDLHIVVCVLEKLVNSISNINRSQLLLPVENEDEKLELVEMEQCSYLDQSCDWLSSDELGVRVVHRQLGPKLACSLGVKQLNQHLTAGGVAVMEWGQREPLTTRLRNLLRQYRDGVAVLKELVQNADDAGATVVQFLYDERENESSRRKLLSQQLEQWQGPALWAYNNASFTESDFSNLRELGGGTKEFQSTKIGKFGLGFCSVYNLTDVPSFVSGCSYVIFDPHLFHLGSENKNPGIRYSFDNDRNCYLLRKLEGQFKPFEHVFGCKLQTTGTFDGTLFRFPLRTPAQASASKISNSSYEHEDMVQLLKMFHKVIGELLLFTQNVKEIKVFHLANNASSPKDKQLLFESSRILRDEYLPSSPGTPLNEVYALYFKGPSSFKWNGKVYECTVFSDIKVQTYPAGKEVCERNVGTCSVTWVTSWHSGMGRLCHLAEGLSGKALPLAAVSAPVVRCSDGWKPVRLADLPCGFYSESHLHCFLPLPVKTPLPVQINGFFQVASDRTALLSKTVDDRQDMNWNTMVIDDAVSAAYHKLISTLISRGLSIDTPYYALWPLHSEKNDVLMSVLIQSFYNSLVADELVLFRSNCGWHPLSQCLFFDKSFQRCEGISSVAFEYMENYLNLFGQQYMIDLPSEVQAGFQSGLITMFSVSQDAFYQKYFIPSLNCELVSPEGRDMLTLNLLDTRGASLNDLKSIACIPTLPNGKLRAPEDLIEPKSWVAALYSVSDERFPVATFISSRERINALRDLDMKTDSIPAEWVCERAGSVDQLECSLCAVVRSREILKYIGLTDEKKVRALASGLNKVPFLPIMEKPNDWKYVWKGDSSQVKVPLWCADHASKRHPRVQIPASFAAPSDLYLPEFRALIGSNHFVLHRTWECDDRSQVFVLKKLGLVTDPLKLPIQSVIQQLIVFTEAPNVDDKMNRWCHNIYSLLEKVLTQENPQIHTDISNLRNRNILLTKHGFAQPELFALSSDADCAPDLFSASLEGLHKYKLLMETLDIKTSFTYTTVMEIMLQKKEICGTQELDGDEVRRISNLLSELFKSRVVESECSELLSSLHLPDAKGRLLPVNKLCVDDGAQLSSGQFFCLHRGIKVSQDMLEWLGIKSKTRKRLEESCNRLHFGQSEPLTTRLKNILEDYPCDSGIMKELLQNADDAGATKIAFIQDLRDLPKDKLFDKQWAPLQGPALSVYNNKGFTARDLENIQDLGNSSKKEDPASTGQYGIGFNAVYHLTDAPSFLTKGPEVPDGETICMFDPHCHYDPGATRDKPGIQLINLPDLRKDHPHSFLGYLEGQLLKDEGTVFRLPLRTRGNSEISKNIISGDKLSEMLNEFQKDMRKCMLFLRNIQEISILIISKSGEMSSKYWTKSYVADKCDMLSRALLGKKGNTVSRKHLYDIGMERESYKLKICDSNGLESNWFVAQQLGAETKDTAPEIVKDAFSHGSLSLLPHACVALLMNSSLSSSENIQTVSCYLPLPVLSGLPFSINGHFALASSRRDLWNGVGDGKAAWNNWLIKEVLVPVAVHALDYCRRAIFPDYTDRASLMTEDEYHAKVHSFYRRLPNAKDILSEQWKNFTKWFYEYVREQQLFFFDLFIPESDKDEKVTNSYPYQSSTEACKKARNGVLVWHAFREDDCEFPVYFVLEKHDKLSRKIVDTLLRLGMKVCTGDMGLRMTIADPEYPYPMLTPATALGFLLSWNTDVIDKCKYVLGHNVKQTPFLKNSNVCEVLEYVSHDPEFKTKIVDLPLLLTNDSVLRHFSIEDPVFISYYCSLLPNLGEQFVHQALISKIYDKYQNFEEANVVKRFTIEDLSVRLMSVLDSSFDCEDAVVSLKMSSSIPNINWIKKLWQFIVREIEKKFGTKNINSGTSVDWKQGWLYILQTLGNWALYPVSINKLLYLIPVSRTWKTLDRTSFPVKSVFRNLPVFYQYMMLDDSTYWPVIPSDLKLTATCEDPQAVLKILYEFKEDIASYINSCDNKKHAQEIMEYLGQHCQKHSLSRSQISSLKIFEDVASQFCSLTGKKLIVPKSMDLCSMRQIALDTECVILKYALSENICVLYRYIDEGFLSEDLDIFANFILPNIACLIEDQRATYMKQLRQLLSELKYKNETEWNASQAHVVSVLKRTKFLEVDGALVTADKLYDPENEVFSVMKFANVPKKWAASEWRDFLKLAGMIHTVTPKMFVEFAQMLHASDREVLAKSKVLVSHLKENWDTLRTALTQLRETEFLVPHCMEMNTVSRILPHFKTPSGLVSYSTGYLAEFQYVLWSSASLLPRYATSSRRMVSELCVSDTAPEDKVIQHISSLSEAMFEAEDVEEKEQMDVMEKIYEHLLNSNAICDHFQQNEVPLIYIPSHKTIVPASYVVVNLEEEIVPYLYQGPSRYGKYFKALIALGMKQRTDADTYAHVLKRVYQASQQQKLNPEESKCMIMAIKGLLKHERQLKDLGVDVLYLPTRNGRLFESARMFVADNQELMAATEDKLKEPLFAGFIALDIEKDNSDFVKRLPVRLRPKFLSEVVQEDLMIGVEEVSTPLFIQLQDFLRYHSLTTAVLRVINHMKVRDALGLTETEKQEIVDKLSQVSVKQLKEVKVIQRLHEEEIGDKSKPYHIQENGPGSNHAFTLYLSDNISSDIIIIALAEMFKMLLDVKDTELMINLFMIFGCFMKPHDIHRRLDSMGIKEYGDLDTSQKLYRADLGSYLEERLLHLLDNKFGQFHEGEIVCMKKYICEDNMEPTEDDIFIVVEVLRLVSKSTICKMLDVYEINVGGEEGSHARVKAHLLYKFIRKQAGPLAVVSQLDEEVPSQSEQEVLEEEEVSEEELRRRIRQEVIQIWQVKDDRERRHLLRRLMFQWHPDKNPHRVELCTRLVQYLQSLVGRLERGETLSNDDEMGDERAPGPSQFYEHTFRPPPPQYTSSHGTFGGGHYRYGGRTNRSSQGTSWDGRRRRDNREARKWWRHAEHDLDEAARRIEGPACWVIYIAHQAAEKFLKACLYAVDRDASRDWRGHSLSELCSRLAHGTAMSLIREVEERVGAFGRMRYPNLNGCPCDAYNAHDAMFVLEKVRRLKEELTPTIQSSGG